MRDRFRYWFFKNLVWLILYAVFTAAGSYLIWDLPIWYRIGWFFLQGMIMLIIIYFLMKYIKRKDAEAYIT